MLGGSFIAAQLIREVALVAFSNGVMINSLGHLLRCKLHHNIKLLLPQAAKIPARGALHPASNVGKRITGRKTARINLRILILTKAGEH